MSVTIKPKLGDQHAPELNVASGDFWDLWNFLEVPYTEIFEGEVSSACLQSRIHYKYRDRNQLCKPRTEIGGVIVEGRSGGMVAGYFAKLQEVVDYAKEFDTEVVWE